MHILDMVHFSTDAMIHLFSTDVMMITNSGTAQQSFLLADGLSDLTDAVKTVDNEIAQQSFLIAESNFPNLASLMPKPSDTMGQDMLKAVEKEAGVATKVDLKELSTDLKADLKELSTKVNDLSALVAVAVVAGGVAWFDLKQGIADLKQGVAGLLYNEQQERILPDVTTELTVGAGNIAVIEVLAPKQLRGFKKKSFFLKSKNEGKVLELMFSHEGIVQTWQQHLPATKIVDPEEQKQGLRYTFTKEETASDTNSPRAELRIELRKPLAPRPWRLLA